MATHQKFNDFVEQLLKGVHNFSAHTFKAALTNVAPVATNAVLADVTQIAASGGYVSGGYTLDSVVLSEAAGTAKVVIADETITAVGDNIGPARYVVLYNDTAAGKPLICFYDRGDSAVIQVGESSVLDFDGTAGIFTLA